MIFCGLLLAALLVALAVLDSLRILLHLYVLAGLALLLFAFNEIATEWLTKWAVRQRIVLLDARWKASVARGSMFYLLSVVGLDQYSTTLFSVLWLCSLVPLLCLPFTAVYPGTLPAGAALAAVVATFAGAFSPSMGIPLALAMGTLAVWRIHRARTRAQKPEVVKTEEEAELERVPGWQRGLLSVAQVLFTAVSIAVSVYWVMLSMNPFWASESEVSKYGPLHRFPPAVSLHVRRVAGVADLEPFRHEPWATPLVIKPNVCTTSSENVQLCHDYDCLVSYVTDLQARAGPEKAKQLSWVVQDYCPAQEAVVFYYRYPYFRRGAIKNIGVRRPAIHTADEQGAALQAKYFPTSYEEGSAAMTAFFDGLADRIPGFSGGRFDVMLEGGLEAAQRGQGIRVLETNIFPLGCIEEKGSGDTWWEATRQSARRLRTTLMQFWFGAYHILSGRQRSLPVLASKVPQLVRRFELCNHNHENLWAVP
jgi:hypothetical protein